MPNPTPFRIEIPEADLEDLKRRLAATRWPNAETVDDWEQGIPLSYVQDLCAYWAEKYDWRAREEALNRFPQWKLKIDGLDIHFIHVRSAHEDARPLVLTHGWPGSVVEFQKVIDALTDPTSHGGEASDAFHVVCPSLPGYGFSDKPTETGWGVQKIADVWSELMQALGYSRYLAQGGDWGAMVTTCIGIQDPEHCAAIHLNMPMVPPDPDTMEDLSEAEQGAIAAMQHYNDKDSGYSKQQGTRPQTLGYGLADSPSAQAAWIVEKFWSWMDCDGHPENVLSKDELLDNVMLYWLTNSGASSARLYWESFSSPPMSKVNVPVGGSIFPKEIFRSSRRWAEKHYGAENLLYWNELDKGGHFAAFEQPKTFVNEVRSCFRNLKSLSRG